MNTENLLIIDGSSFLHRAYHGYANANIIDESGRQISAIYGLVEMFRKLERKITSTAWICVFDPAKSKSFRYDIYPEYKKNRTKYEDLEYQKEIVPKIVSHLGITTIVDDRYEADDIIGTLAVSLFDKCSSILIATGDKDLAQLVNNKVKLINTMNDEVTDIKGVNKRFNVNPEQIIDYLSIVGDTSDNIPGVLGCGAVTASKLLQEYKTLDEILKNIENLKPSIKTKFINSSKELELSKKLVTLDLNCEIKGHILSDVRKFYKEVNIYTSTQHVLNQAQFPNFIKSILSKDTKTSNSLPILATGMSTVCKDWSIEENGNYIYTETLKLIKIIWQIRLRDNQFFLSNNFCGFELCFNNLSDAQKIEQRSYIISIMVNKKIIKI